MDEDERCEAGRVFFVSGVDVVCLVVVWAAGRPAREPESPAKVQGGLSGDCCVFGRRFNFIFAPNW